MKNTWADEISPTSRACWAISGPDDKGTTAATLCDTSETGHTIGEP